MSPPTLKLTAAVYKVGRTDGFIRSRRTPAASIDEKTGRKRDEEIHVGDNGTKGERGETVRERESAADASVSRVAYSSRPDDGNGLVNY
jgi:hypothetical protein